MSHVEQQSHGCTTLASKHANHLTTSKVCAPLLRVHTTLYDARTNDRETQCDRKRRTRSPLNFKHAQKSDATAGERKIACNGSDSSCNVGEPSCECQNAGSQSVLKWSCANCERGLIGFCSFFVAQPTGWNCASNDVRHVHYILINCRILIWKLGIVYSQLPKALPFVQYNTYLNFR